MVENFEKLLSRVDEQLFSIIDKKMQGKVPKELYEPIAYVLEGGGKRIRPVFVLMAAQIWGGNLDKAIEAALGIEYFHNFTLMHDDVMDRADFRRSRPTVHKKWNQNTAILSGDAMFVLAYEQILASSANCKNPQGLMAAFNKLALGVCEGQQYDMDFETAAEVSMEDYYCMIDGKTSALLAGALQIGAIMASAPKEAEEVMFRIGIHFGRAFQLQDDLLDLYANEEKFGKKIGSDIRECKKTFLYLKALELLGAEKAEELKKLFCLEAANEANFEERLKAVSALYEEVDIRKHCNIAIKEEYEKAYGQISKLEALGANKEALCVLERFIKKLFDREF